MWTTAQVAMASLKHSRARVRHTILLVLLVPIRELPSQSLLGTVSSRVRHRVKDDGAFKARLLDNMVAWISMRYTTLNQALLVVHALKPVPL